MCSQNASYPAHVPAKFDVSPTLNITIISEGPIYQFIDEDKDLSLGVFCRLDISVDSESPSLISDDFNIAVKAVDSRGEFRS